MSKKFQQFQSIKSLCRKMNSSSSLKSVAIVIDKKHNSDQFKTIVFNMSGRQSVDVVRNRRELLFALDKEQLSVGSSMMLAASIMTLDAFTHLFYLMSQEGYQWNSPEVLDAIAEGERVHRVITRCCSSWLKFPYFHKYFLVCVRLWQQFLYDHENASMSNGSCQQMELLNYCIKKLCLSNNSNVGDWMASVFNRHDIGRIHAYEQNWPDFSENASSNHVIIEKGFDYQQTDATRFTQNTRRFSLCQYLSTYAKIFHYVCRNHPARPS